MGFKENGECYYCQSMTLKLYLVVLVFVVEHWFFLKCLLLFISRFILYCRHIYKVILTFRYKKIIRLYRRLICVDAVVKRENKLACDIYMYYKITRFGMMVIETISTRDKGTYMLVIRDHRTAFNTINSFKIENEASK